MFLLFFCFNSFGQFGRSLDFKPLDLSGVEVFQPNITEIIAAKDAEQRELTKISLGMIKFFDDKRYYGCSNIKDKMPDGKHAVFFTNKKSVFGKGYAIVRNNKVTKVELEGMDTYKILESSSAYRCLSIIKTENTVFPYPSTFLIYFTDTLIDCK